MFRPGPSPLRTERLLAQPHHRRLPGAVINGHYIKPAWTLANVSLRYKSLCRANQHVLFVPGNTKFWQRRQAFPDGAGSDLHKCQRLAIVTDEIDFSLNAARSVIPGYEYVPLLPQIPVMYRFLLARRCAEFLLFRIIGKTLLSTQAAARRPVHRPKHQL